jgi:hypothetical protein
MGGTGVGAGWGGGGIATLRGGATVSLVGTTLRCGQVLLLVGGWTIDVRIVVSWCNAAVWLLGWLLFQWIIA